MSRPDKKTTGASRRRFLLGLTGAVAAAAAVVAALPFVRSLLPSERARVLGAPVRVRVDDLAPGETRLVRWRGRAIVILNRAPEMLASLANVGDRVLDKKTSDREWQPEYVDPVHRAQRRDLLVVDATCTHLGCVPGVAKEAGHPRVGEWFPGGFVCACHYSAYDFAGRVVKGPAPRNLKVPPHRFEGAGTVVIGEDPLTA